MKYSYQIAIRKYEYLARPTRLTVGDVIRCEAFRSGLIILHKAGYEKAVSVAWKNQAHFDGYILAGDGIDATDELRGLAPFLVTSITLEEVKGPEDIGAPARLSRLVRAVRLTEEGLLRQDAEHIVFWLDDPLALSRPDLDEIELLGYATLPIGWEI